MKEDASYCTFMSNSLFLPINMFGVMTIENPSVDSDCNMKSLMHRTLEENSTFFIERFTEGILMAMLGNSRDEGYFACMRMIFMVLYARRKGDHTANWDIDSFCKKTNECLLDNPFSMHFHRTIMKVINEYCDFLI